MRSIKHPFPVVARLSPAVLATAGAFLGMFALGYAENLKGPTITALMNDLGFRYSQGGTILLGAYLGYLLSTPGAGMLVDRLGAQRVAPLAALSMFAGALLYSLSSTFLLLTGAMFIIGLGLGMLNVTGNSLIITYHAAHKGRLLNQMGFFHSMASTLAPFIAGQMLAAGLTWRTVYHFSLLPSLLLLLYFAFVRIGPPPSHNGYPVVRPLPAAPAGRRSVFDARIAGYYLLAVTYCATEIGVAAWMVEFLQKTKGFSVASSSAYLAGFFACIMVGRLLGSLVVERAGYRKTILAAGLGVLICLLLGAYGPVGLAFFLPVSGLFCSVIFPTMTAAISTAAASSTLESTAETGSDNRVLGMFFAAAGLGGLVGSWSIGFASDYAGLQAGFGIMIGTALLLVLLTLRLKR